jgi:hypothetical protein
MMLILQLCAAVGLTLALARPVSSFLLNQPEQTIYILDMTTSMAAIDVPQNGVAGQAVQRFDVARQSIVDSLQTMDGNDRVAALALNSNPSLLFSTNAAETEAAMQILNRLRPGGSQVDLAATLALANELVDPERANRIVILTDGNYELDPDLLPPALAPLEWQLIPQQRPDGDNQALLNVSSSSLPDNRYRVFARVVNYSESPVVRTVSLAVDDATPVEERVEIEPQSDVARVWTLPAQAEAALIEIVEPDDLPVDNRAELFLTGATRLKTLLLSDAPETLVRALVAQPGVELTVRSANFSGYAPADYDLIVFDGLPPEQTEWPAGNVLVVNPSLGHPLLAADSFARGLRPDPDSASALLSGIDLSGVFFNRAPNLALPDWAEVDLLTIADKNGQTFPLVFHGIVNNSRVLVWGFDLDASNLPARLALPLLTATSISTLLTPVPLASVGLGDSVTLTGDFGVELPDGRRLALDTRLTNSTGPTFSRTELPGIYRLYDGNDSVVGGFAVHAGSPFESNLTQRLQPENLAGIDAAALPAPDRELAIEEFWPLLAALVLVVVTFEGWLAWRR